MNNEAEFKYRDDDLLALSTETGSLEEVDSDGFYAHQSLPRFMVAWGEQEAGKYGPDRIVTTSMNASNGCEIGNDALCGQFCFAHKGWNGKSPRPAVAKRYTEEARRLRERGYESSIFLSTDTEPLPGHDSQVTHITRDLLRAMLDEPPKGLILHTHTDVSASDDLLPILKDLSSRTNLIVGIGFETDVEDLPNGLPKPFTSIRGRLDTIERLSDNGIKTQAAVAPLVGFRDFDAFGRVFKNIGTHRIMVGDLRLDFEIGGTEKAATLKERLGLPAPTQGEAKEYFEDEGFAPHLVAFRDQFYVVLPEESN